LLLQPAAAHACLVFAHGAGAPMAHPSMESQAVALCAAGVATLRFQFPYMQRGARRTDPPSVCHAAVRAAVAEASRQVPALPLFAGGRSFGGRMTSQAQAAAPLAGVMGLIFFAFPLHPAGKPGVERAAHLEEVQLPMLFLQGTRDALAEMALLEPVVARLGPRASLELIEDADHSFHLRRAAGRTDQQVKAELAARCSTWMRQVCPAH
jgi:predicted alpha/beta-hydrolase family hydrolase